MLSIALFNHKGGVGKTTLTVNLAGGFVEHGKRVLLIDADPQCNISSFFIAESQLDTELGESSEADGGRTIWSAVKPVVVGTGDVVDIPVHPILVDDLLLVLGDVLLSSYEEELPAAWTDSFARKQRGYAVMSAIHRAAELLAKKVRADIVMYDVGPNVGPLNRAIILGCDYFVTPVAPDLFSLRALTSVGGAVARWIQDWRTVQTLAPSASKEALLPGNPKYLGYIVSAFKAYGGAKSQPHEYWESKIAPRVKMRVVDALRAVDTTLVCDSPYKIGEVKHFQSMAAIAQDHGLPIGWLQGHANSGYNPEIAQARAHFHDLAGNILRRIKKAGE